MDLQENTKKTGPGHELQTEQPGTEHKNKPAHKCSICDSPNHNACGCEARLLREAIKAGLTENEAKALQEPEQQPAAEPDPLIIGRQIQEQFENAISLLGDAIAFLKLIADDMITIRKMLCEVEEETEDPDQPEIKQS